MSELKDRHGSPILTEGQRKAREEAAANKKLMEYAKSRGIGIPAYEKIMNNKVSRQRVRAHVGQDGALSPRYPEWDRL